MPALAADNGTAGSHFKASERWATGLEPTTASTNHGLPKAKREGP